MRKEIMNRDIICHEDLHIHAVKEFEGQLVLLELLENRRILTCRLQCCDAHSHCS